MQTIFTLNWKNVLGAITSAVIVAVATYVANLTNLTDFSLRSVEAIVVLTASASLIKNFTTTASGNFAGVVPVK